MNIMKLVYIPTEIKNAVQELRSDLSLDTVKKIKDLDLPMDTLEGFRNNRYTYATISFTAFSTAYVIATEAINQILSATITSVFRRSVCSIALGLSIGAPLAIGCVTGLVAFVAFNALSEEESSQTQDLLIAPPVFKSTDFPVIQKNEDLKEPVPPKATIHIDLPSEQINEGSNDIIPSKEMLYLENLDLALFA